MAHSIGVTAEMLVSLESDVFWSISIFHLKLNIQLLLNKIYQENNMKPIAFPYSWKTRN